MNFALNVTIFFLLVLCTQNTSHRLFVLDADVFTAQYYLCQVRTVVCGSSKAYNDKFLLAMKDVYMCRVSMEPYQLKTLIVID